MDKLETPGRWFCRVRKFTFPFVNLRMVRAEVEATGVEVALRPVRRISPVTSNEVKGTAVLMPIWAKPLRAKLVL